MADPGLARPEVATPETPGVEFEKLAGGGDMRAAVAEVARSC
jgi:hypothetical protein